MITEKIYKSSWKANVCNDNLSNSKGHDDDYNTILSKE